MLRGVLLGQLDVGLSEEGRRQALGLAGKVKNATLVTSPMKRARETAQALGPTTLVVEEFREWSYGHWDGLAWEEIVARFPREAAAREADWFGYTAPGQERWADFVARVHLGWEKVRHLPAPIAIVAHQAVNGVLWELWRGEPAHRFRQGYCEILEA